MPPVLVDPIVLGISFLVDPDRDRVFRAHLPDNSLAGQLVGNGSSHEVAVGDYTTQPLTVEDERVPCRVLAHALSDLGGGGGNRYWIFGHDCRCFGDLLRVPLVRTSRTVIAQCFGSAW